MTLMESSAQLIGNTPLLKLRRVTAGMECDILVKCEFLNPSGSIKDRAALQMIEGALKRGELQPGGTVVDATSGNTGIALSFVGSAKGLKTRLLIPSKWIGSYDPDHRARIMRIFGAEVEKVDVEPHRSLLSGLTSRQYSTAVYALVMKACYDLARKDDRIWWANQMSNPDNVLAHQIGTGRELIQQTEGRLAAFVASVGNGGTLLGVGEALRNAGLRDTRLVGVDPEDTRYIEDLGKSGFLREFLSDLGMPIEKLTIEVMTESGIPDEMIYVSHEEARTMANRLASEEGLFCGISSGANVLAAIRVAKSLPRNSAVATVLVDSRDRYLPEYPRETYVV